MARQGTAAARFDPRHAGRSRTPRSRKSRRAQATAASCRCCCRRAQANRLAAAATGRSTKPPCAPDLPIGMHVGGVSGYPATAGSGAPSYYIEEHHSLVQAMQAVVTSLVRRRRVRAIPEPEGRAGRRRLCLAARTEMAARQCNGSAARRSPASHTRAVGIYPRPLLVHDAADRRAGHPRTISTTSCAGSASTASCSRPTIRIGTSTIPAMCSKARSTNSIAA